MKGVLLMIMCCLVGKGFDEDNVVLSLGVLSDVHIEKENGEETGKFASALRQLEATAAQSDKDGLDGIMIAGDLINNVYSDSLNAPRQSALFKTIYESVLDPKRVPLLYTPGNHDSFKQWNEASPRQVKIMRQIFSASLLGCEVVESSLEELECIHYRIKGLDVLAILPNSLGPITYPQASLEWMDAMMDSITRVNPDRYVPILTHPMLWHTVYGSELGEHWYTGSLNQILEKYPQAMTFSGHLHFPLNDPRSIWQGSFTALGCGSVRYMAIEDGRYEEMAGKTIMKDRNQFSQGLLLQFDKKGNARLKRMDFYHEATIGEDWVLPHPDKKGNNLLTYCNFRREKENKAPKLSTFSFENGELIFSKGSDDEFVHHYIIGIFDGNGFNESTRKILSDFYLHPQTSEMKNEYRLDVRNLAKGQHTATLLAVDSWGKESNKLTIKFEIGNE